MKIQKSAWSVCFLTPALFSLLLVATLGASSCKTGNFTEQTVTVDQPANADKWSGFYRTEAYSMDLCANFTDPTLQTKCLTSPASPANYNWIPPNLSAVLVNPIAFVMDDVSKGYAAIVDPETYKQTQLALGVLLNTQSLNIEMDLAGTPISFLGYTKCVRSERAYTDSDSVNHLNITDDRIKVGIYETRGTLELAANYTYVFDAVDNSNICETALLDAQQCYLDETVCGYADPASNTKLHQQLIKFFGPHIDAGVLTSSQIQFVKSLSYKVFYK